MIDALIIGAGAAGLFCAGELGRRGKRAVVIDHAAKPGEKIRISGGGRCNFTNIHTEPARFLSENPHFAKSALARYAPEDFLALMRKHGLHWHEKTLGQLFCDERSGAVVTMLMDEIAGTGGAVSLGVKVRDIAHDGARFRIETDNEAFHADHLVVATGGLSVPKMGATGFAYDLARRFGHDIAPPRPALVPFVFAEPEREDFAALAGVGAPVRARAGEGAFEEAMLFTHRGLSGPAILQASSYWRDGEAVVIDFFPGADGGAVLKALKEVDPRATLARALEARFPKRLADYLFAGGLAPQDAATRRLADIPDATLGRTGARLGAWTLFPSGTEGWRTAEVTAGGVATDRLSSKTMASREVSGLFFIGECVDVTGWLGGYNFQWAWASAHAAAEAIALR